MVRFPSWVVSPSTVRCRSSAANSPFRSSLWDAKANKAAGRSLEAQRINEKLENIKTNIGKQYQRLCDRDSYVTAEKVRNAFPRYGGRLPPAVADLRRIPCRLPQRVGKDRAYSSYEDYCKRRRRLASFLEYEYRVKDIAFKELKREFIEKFVVYLSSVQGMRSGTIHSTIKKLKLMTYTAYKNGWIAADPFAGFYVRPEYSERRYLSASELQAVMDVRAAQLPDGHQPGCLRLLRLYGPEPCGRGETYPRGHPYGR